MALGEGALQPPRSPAGSPRGQRLSQLPWPECSSPLSHPAPPAAPRTSGSADPGLPRPPESEPCFPEVPSQMTGLHEATGGLLCLQCGCPRLMEWGIHCFLEAGSWATAAGGTEAQPPRAPRAVTGRGPATGERGPSRCLSRVLSPSPESLQPFLPSCSGPWALPPQAASLLRLVRAPTPPAPASPLAASSDFRNSVPTPAVASQDP